jgi:hypothetical protein
MSAAMPTTMEAACNRSRLAFASLVSQPDGAEELTESLAGGGTEPYRGDV